MAIVLFWVALGALAMGALNWLFPAWPNEKRGIHEKEDIVKMLMLRHVRDETTPAEHHVVQHDLDEVGPAQKTTGSLGARAPRRGAFMGRRLGDLYKEKIMRDRTATDPVCRMQVDPATARAKTEYKGQTYYFCCRGCRAAFEGDPEHYIGEYKRPQHQHAQ